MTRVPVFAVACGLLLPCACGADEPREVWRSELDADASIALAGEDARRDMCESLDDHLSARLDFSKLTRLMCLPTGLLRGSSPAVCEALVDECTRSRAPQPLWYGARIDQWRCQNNLAHCSSPVAALEACINLNVARVLDTLGALTCERFGDAETTQRARRAARLDDLVVKCADLPNACQFLVEDVVVR